MQAQNHLGLKNWMKNWIDKKLDFRDNLKDIFVAVNKRIDILEKLKAFSIDTSLVTNSINSLHNQV